MFRLCETIDGELGETFQFLFRDFPVGVLRLFLRMRNLKLVLFSPGQGCSVTTLAAGQKTLELFLDTPVGTADDTTKTDSGSTQN